MNHPTRNTPSEQATLSTASSTPYKREHPRYTARVHTAESFPPPRPLLKTPDQLKPIMLLGIAMALLLATIFTVSAILSLFGQDDLSHALGGTNELSEVSTPSSEWKRGTIPLLYQTDKAWGAKPYAGGTIAENGCGPTCLTMAYVALTGRKDYDPVSMCAFSERNGFVDGGATSWSFMSDGANMLGLRSEELPAEASSVLQVLALKNPIVCVMGPGDFTTTGHFIVLAGVDENGRIIVRDPNSAERSAKAWDIEIILSQCRNLWALSA